MRIRIRGAFAGAAEYDSSGRDSPDAIKTENQK